MKALLKSPLVICAFALALIADTGSVSGQWKVSTSISDRNSDILCTFTQKEGAIGGNCTTERGSVDISGTVEGDKVKWSYKSEYDGAPLTVKYAGAFTSSSRIKGTVEVPEYGVSGDFTANRSE